MKSTDVDENFVDIDLFAHSLEQNIVYSLCTEKAKQKRLGTTASKRTAVPPLASDS